MGLADAASPRRGDPPLERRHRLGGRPGGTWAPPLCAVGARGFTSGLINVWPEHSVAIHAALEAGDYRRANELIAVMLEFEEIRAEEQNGTNVTAVKAALQLMGEDCGPTRPPSAWPLNDAQMARLRTLLESWRQRERTPARDRRAG
jgi:4-hydroxy-tetrahydrodipicolinate synthase